MAGLDKKTPTPTEITLHQQSRMLELRFGDGAHYSLPCEFLRVFSAIGGSARPRPGSGNAADRQAQGRHHRARTGRQLRRAADLFRRAQHRHLLLGLALRSGQESGRAVGRLPCTHRSGRRQSRYRFNHAPAQESRRLRRRSLSRHTRTPQPKRDVQGRTMAETHFGYETVDETEKAQRVAGVFSSVAQKLRRDERPHVGGAAPAVEEIHHRDGCAASGRAGARCRRRHRRSVRGLCAARRHAGSNRRRGLADRHQQRHARASAAIACSTRACCRRWRNATPRSCPFPTDHFDIVTVAFGLRNMTHKDRGAGRNAPRAAARRATAGARVFARCGNRWHRSTMLLVQGAALARRENRRRRDESTVISPNRSACIRIRPRSRRMMEQAGLERVEVFQPDRRRRRAASRLQVLTRRSNQ